MTPEQLDSIGQDFDEIFLLIGGAVLAIELLKGLFTRSMTGRTLLDMVANISTQIPFLLMESFVFVFAYVGFQYASDYMIEWAMPLTVSTVVLTVLVSDFIYYWEHRFAHQIRLFWTQHAVHHSSREMNITVAVRFGPLESVLSIIMHAPLILMGIPAEAVFFGILIVQAYQTWIHTELIGKLGVLGSIFNTPANHRVHHGCDDKYIDKNYGGILIIWDRMFGTYQREEETPRYGLKRDFNSVNPLEVWISELPGFFRDIGGSKSFGEAWMRIFGPPAWQPKTKPQTEAERLTPAE